MMVHPGPPNAQSMRWITCRYSLPTQSHFYMETQNAVAEPGEDGTMRVWSSTQTMDGVQSAVARVLAVPAHSVEVGVFPLSFLPCCICGLKWY